MGQAKPEDVLPITTRLPGWEGLLHLHSSQAESAITAFPRQAVGAPSVGHAS